MIVVCSMCVVGVVDCLCCDRGWALLVLLLMRMLCVCFMLLCYVLCWCVFVVVGCLLCPSRCVVMLCCCIWCVMCVCIVHASWFNCVWLCRL